MSRAATTMKPRFRHRLTTALIDYLSGLVVMSLTVMAFHPLAWRPLLVVGPALFLVVLKRRQERGYWPTWWGGMSAWGYGMLAWIGSLAGAELAGVIGCTIVSGIFLLMSWPFGWILRRFLRASWPCVIAAPLVMTAFDAFRHLSSKGLSWHDLGYALADWNRLIQIADIASVYPLSALIWALNGLVADFILARLKLRPASPQQLRRAASVIAIAFLTLWLYGHERIRNLEGKLKPGPKMAGLQTAIPQAEKMTPGLSPAEYRHGIALDLMTAAVAADADIDLFVWPETSFFPLDDSSATERRGAPLFDFLNRQRQATRRSVAEEFAARLPGRFQDVHHVVGAIHRDDMPAGDYDEAGLGVRERNSAFLLSPAVVNEQPQLREIARADKMKLVPMGEYIPFPALRFMRAELQDFVRATAGYLPAMTAGKEVAVWQLPRGQETLPITVNVCYEVVFPEIFREGRKRGALMALNVSNDSWYDDSAERDLVHAQLRFRAIENRFSIFRVSNTGISVSMDPLGRERALLARDERGYFIDSPVLGIGPPLALFATRWLEWSLLAAVLLLGFLTPRSKSRSGTDLGHSPNP